MSFLQQTLFFLALYLVPNLWYFKSWILLDKIIQFRNIKVLHPPLSLKATKIFGQCSANFCWTHRTLSWGCTIRLQIYRHFKIWFCGKDSITTSLFKGFFCEFLMLSVYYPMAARNAITATVFPRLQAVLEPFIMHTYK